MSSPVLGPPSPKQAAVAVAATFAAWRIFKALTARPHPLDHVPGPLPESWFTGCILKVFNPAAWDYHEELARKYPGVARIPSMMGDVMLHVHDPGALHHILVKDQSIYEESEDFIRVNGLVLGPGLLATLGDQHRKQRKLLNPVFSIAHMRNLIPVFYQVGHKLRDSINEELAEGAAEIDLLLWMSRAALELIGQSGFGTSFDSLKPGATATQFASSLKSMMGSLSNFTFSRFIVLPKLDGIGSPGFRRWVVDILPWKQLHNLRDMVNCIHDVSSEIYRRKKREVEAEKEAGIEDELSRKDVISILLKANMAASESEQMPEHEVIGQMSTLIFAATDTTSNALSRVIHLLSKDILIQERLRAEIIEARERNGGEDLDYDMLVQLPLLGAVCRETLRLHPPIPLVMRQARADAILPLSRPFISNQGNVVSEVLVPCGTQVLVSIMACNRDPAIWGPDAHNWRPDRWLSALPETVTSAKVPGIYSHLMTFIGGGRSCIGFKFSQLEMKVILCLLLETFRFEPGKKEIIWQYNGVSQPSVEAWTPGSMTMPALKLPMKVSLVA